MADPGFGGRRGVNCHKQGRSPCSRHEVAKGGGEGVKGGGGGGGEGGGGVPLRRRKVNGNH